jgi:hypothetical protein
VFDKIPINGKELADSVIEFLSDCGKLFEGNFCNFQKNTWHNGSFRKAVNNSQVF